MSTNEHSLALMSTHEYGVMSAHGAKKFQKNKNETCFDGYPVFSSARSFYVIMIFGNSNILDNNNRIYPPPLYLCVESDTKLIICDLSSLLGTCPELDRILEI